MTPDSFIHVPELRDQITPFAHSVFRQDFPAFVRQLARDKGFDVSDLYDDATRTALHDAFLADHSGDLWVFAYGSLIWDPALDFAQLRRATVQGYARKMCLFDNKGARGSAAAPGLIAGLAPGDHCHGMAFLIPAERVADETRYLWGREVIAPGYLAQMLPAQTPQGPIDVLAFVADLSHDQIRPDLPADVQAHLVATGQGELGSSFDYVKSIVDRFALLGIDDPDLSDLYQRARALRG
ncbi:MAG: gamma-glutamylcyclotransferase [Pseudomonadota bacterium]